MHEHQQPGGLTVAVADSVDALWQHLGIRPVEVDVLWQYQATDLQSQLSVIASDKDFCLEGALAYASNHWPAELTQVFGVNQDKHVLLLPLSHKVGV